MSSSFSQLGQLFGGLSTSGGNSNVASMLELGMLLGHQKNLLELKLLEAQKTIHDLSLSQKDSLLNSIRMQQLGGVGLGADLLTSNAYIQQQQLLFQQQQQQQQQRQVETDYFGNSAAQMPPAPPISIPVQSSNHPSVNAPANIVSNTTESAQFAPKAAGVSPKYSGNSSLNSNNDSGSSPVVNFTEFSPTLSSISPKKQSPTRYIGGMSDSSSTRSKVTGVESVRDITAQFISDEKKALDVQKAQLKSQKKLLKEKQEKLKSAAGKAKSGSDIRSINNKIQQSNADIFKLKKIQSFITDRENKLMTFEDMFLNNKLDEISMINTRKELSREIIDNDPYKGSDYSMDSVDSDDDYHRSRKHSSHAKDKFTSSRAHGDGAEISSKAIKQGHNPAADRHERYERHEYKDIEIPFVKSTSTFSSNSQRSSLSSHADSKAVTADRVSFPASVSLASSNPLYGSSTSSALLSNKVVIPSYSASEAIRRDIDNFTNQQKQFHDIYDQHTNWLNSLHKELSGISSSGTASNTLSSGSFGSNKGGAAFNI